MSIVEALICMGCTRWMWRRCAHSGGDDSVTWPLATPEAFSPVPRICRLILAVYHSSSDGPHTVLNPDWITKRATYQQTQGRVPPYIIYTDHRNKEIVLAIRGLNLVKDSDYKVLLDNGLGMKKFDGGYVHHGLMTAAVWLLTSEAATLRRLWVETGREYEVVFAGHSLGSGVAALAAVAAAKYWGRLGGVPRRKVRCYAVAPARCVSRDLAVKYADVVQSVVLQDDFLPRTPTPLEDIFKSIFCLPCLSTELCLKDTFRRKGRRLRDQRTLYPPGRLYHIVNRKSCRCGRLPPEVRTAISMDGKFEHIVLSCNATSDHAIFWIEREAEKALQTMSESSTLTITTAPTIQRLERPQEEELERTSSVPTLASLNQEEAVSSQRSESSDTDWDDLVEKLFNTN